MCEFVLTLSDMNLLWCRLTQRYLMNEWIKFSLMSHAHTFLQPACVFYVQNTVCTFLHNNTESENKTTETMSHFHTFMFLRSTT